jgi:HPt (histidine-containing phosphotransfer) domain-containing protein
VVVQHGDFELATRLAHDLVARAGALGADPLARQASELEEALRNQHFELATKLSTALRAEHVRVLDAIHAHLNQGG